MGIVKSLIKQFLEKGEIVYKAKFSASAYHIRIQSESIKTAEFVPGYFLRLVFGIDKDGVALQDTVRSYSVWDINRSKGTADLVIVNHSKGVGARWVETCEMGDTVYFKWKKGNFIVDNSANSYLMIGDLSALAHLYCIRRYLASDKRIESIFYSQDKSDFFPDTDGRFSFQYYEMPENPVLSVIEKVKQLFPRMIGTPMVYVAGDSRLCVALHQYLKNELKLGNDQIRIKPFWNPLKKGLE